MARRFRRTSPSLFSLWALGFMTVVAAGAFAAMILGVDPNDARSSTFATFYAALFTSVTGAVAWVFLFLRGRLGKTKRPLAFFFHDAVRQGALVAAIITASLFLQGRRELSLGSVLLLVTAAFAAEALLARVSGSSA